MIRNRIGSSAFLLFLTVAILSGAVSAQGKKVSSEAEILR
jgi:hypothetical protein